MEPLTGFPASSLTGLLVSRMMPRTASKSPPSSGFAASMSPTRPAPWGDAMEVPWKAQYSAPWLSMHGYPFALGSLGSLRGTLFWSGTVDRTYHPGAPAVTLLPNAEKYVLVRSGVSAAMVMTCGLFAGVFRIASWSLLPAATTKMVPLETEYEMASSSTRWAGPAGPPRLMFATSAPFLPA